jgi:preprotein translocase subunit SecA
LELLDLQWKEHLLQLDHLRQGIGLRGYAQRDPLIEYKREAFNLFEGMLARLREMVTSYLAHIELQLQEPEQLVAERTLPEMHASHIDPITGENDAALPPPPGAMVAGAPARGAVQEIDPDDPGTWGKVGRNAPCPCGSGKKFKRCHGKVA